MNRELREFVVAIKKAVEDRFSLDSLPARIAEVCDEFLKKYPPEDKDPEDKDHEEAA